MPASGRRHCRCARRGSAALRGRRSWRRSARRTRAVSGSRRTPRHSCSYSTLDGKGIFPGFGEQFSPKGWAAHVGRRLGPQVLQFFGRGGAPQYLVAVRVASETLYHVAGSFGLRDPELGLRAQVGRGFGRFLLSSRRLLRCATASTKGLASSKSQRRRSRCPHPGHRRTHSPSSSTGSRYSNSSPPQSQLSRTGVSSRSTGLATGCSASPAMRSRDSKADRRRPARRCVSGTPAIRVRSVRCCATAA